MPQRCDEPELPTSVASNPRNIRVDRGSKGTESVRVGMALIVTPPNAFSSENPPSGPENAGRGVLSPPPGCPSDNKPPSCGSNTPGVVLIV